MRSCRRSACSPQWSPCQLENKKGMPKQNFQIKTLNALDGALSNQMQRHHLCLKNGSNSMNRVANWSFPTFCAQNTSSHWILRFHGIQKLKNEWPGSITQTQRKFIINCSTKNHKLLTELIGARPTKSLTIKNNSLITYVNKVDNKNCKTTLMYYKSPAYSHKLSNINKKKPHTNYPTLMKRSLILTIQH